MKKVLKKLISISIIFALALCFVSCKDSGKDDATQTTGNYKYKIEVGQREVEGKTESYKYYVITGYEVASEDLAKINDGDFSSIKNEHRNIVIPAKGTDMGLDKDYPVEKIDSSAFTGHAILKSVVVGSNIKSIGAGAFSGCVNLESLTLPFIGKSQDAVNEERTLAYLFGSSATGNGNMDITVKVHTLNDDDAGTTYKVPESLKTVTVTGEMESVKESAFYGFTNLTTVNLPKTVKEIERYAFANCSSLISVNFADSENNVEVFYKGAFSGCTSLYDTSIIKNSKVVDIYESAFAGCSVLGKQVLQNEVLVMPATLASIGKSAFLGCEQLKGINLEDTSVTEIKSATFENCYMLDTVELKTDTLIKTGAFSGCSKISDATKNLYTNKEVDAFGYDKD